MGLLGLQLERLAHIGLGLVPLLGTLLADAAVIVVDAVGLVVIRRQRLDAQRVGLGAVGELLAPPLDIADPHDAFEVPGVLPADGLQYLHPLFAALPGVDI